MDNYGYIPTKIDEQEHYILGDGWLQAQVLMPNSHGWGDYLPKDEDQRKNGLETMNCSNYGTNHALAILGKKKFGAQFQTDLSERYGGTMTGTTMDGNDPHTVIEKIRTFCGVVPEVFLPFDTSITSWAKYYSPKPMSYWLYATGKHWLKKYKVGHDWVFTSNIPLKDKQDKMKYALQFSPLGASVFAWSQHVDGMYYSDQPGQNHWITVYDFVEDQYWMIFDSYDNTHKKLAWNFDFGQVKRYSLEFNGTGAVLGDKPESAITSYVFYLLGLWAKEIIK